MTEKRPHYKLQFRITSILSPDGISHAVERTKSLPDANSFVDSTRTVRERIADNPLSVRSFS